MSASFVPFCSNIHHLHHILEMNGMWKASSGWGVVNISHITSLYAVATAYSVAASVVCSFIFI